MSWEIRKTPPTLNGVLCRNPHTLHICLCFYIHINFLVEKSIINPGFPIYDSSSENNTVNTVSRFSPCGLLVYGNFVNYNFFCKTHLYSFNCVFEQQEENLLKKIVNLQFTECPIVCLVSLQFKQAKCKQWILEAWTK